ncbi:hypothetical protein TEHN7126_1993 [Tetragenococcus halophilus subsp. halophilus]|uniref:helix-turn-helix transcriptional regulator n=1 Tax=Tetragenococcus halophilus TaxID=51669 RepID=UPI000CBEDE89|nr:helix-turn-helix transcriptional regulator [Tetragenococcus halophilus]GBD73874.1 hypothetical protein TEHN7125_2034 [Tetragenococcus halophilus subsp. halophilus]GBD76294.1 hypothetical protein TEHN7126_1993 [Tetragenococcus halophilus subsp. halophilus]
MRKKLKTERLNAKMTREQLAEKIGVSEVYVRKLEYGTRKPSSETAVKFAELFQKPLDYLFPDIFLLSFDTKRNKNKKAGAK